MSIWTTCLDVGDARCGPRSHRYGKPSDRATSWHTRKFTFKKTHIHRHTHIHSHIHISTYTDISSRAWPMLHLADCSDGRLFRLWEQPMLSVTDCLPNKPNVAIWLWTQLYQSSNRAEISFDISASTAPLANSAMMSTLTARGQWEDKTVRERTGRPPSYAEAKKMKSQTLRPLWLP